MNHCLYYQQRSRNSKKLIQTKEQKSKKNNSNKGAEIQTNNSNKGVEIQKKIIQTKEHKFNIKGLDGKGLCCHAAELLC